MNLDSMIKQNDDFFVTETTIKPNVSMDELFTVLRTRKTTGSVILEFVQGGVRRIRVAEKTKATESERDRLRSILEMNGQP